MPIGVSNEHSCSDRFVFCEGFIVRWTQGGRGTCVVECPRKSFAPNLCWGAAVLWSSAVEFGFVCPVSPGQGTGGWAESRRWLCAVQRVSWQCGHCRRCCSPRVPFQGPLPHSHGLVPEGPVDIHHATAASGCRKRRVRRPPRATGLHPLKGAEVQKGVGRRAGERGAFCIRSLRWRDVCPPGPRARGHDCAAGALGRGPEGNSTSAVPPLPLAQAWPCLSTGWALNRRFQEILGPLFLWSQM